MKSRYCRNESTHCAVFYVMFWISHGYIVPDDFCMDEVGTYLMEMTPTDHSRARSIIESMYLPDSQELPLLYQIFKEAEVACTVHPA